MSRGQFKPRAHSDRVMERCRNKSCTDRVVIFDVDKGEIDYISAEAPLSSQQGFRPSGAVKPNEKVSPSSVIRIDDEDSSDGCISHKNADTNASSSYSSEDDEFIMFVEKGKEACHLPKYTSTYQESGNSRYMFDLNNNTYEFGKSASESYDLETSDSNMSESNNSDCEILDDSSGNIREEWEKAASKRRVQDKSQTSEECASTSGSDNESRIPYGETTHKEGKYSSSHCTKQFKNYPDHHSQNSVGNLHKDPELSDPSFKQNYSSVGCSGENGAKDISRSHVGEEPNSGVSSPCEGADFVTPAAPIKQPLFSGLFQDDQHLKYHEAGMCNKDVPKESYHRAEFRERFHDMMNINVDSPSSCNQQYNNEHIHSNATLNNMKENLPSQSVCNNQGQKDPSHGIVNFQGKCHTACGEPLISTLDGQHLEPRDVAVHPLSCESQKLDKRLTSIGNTITPPEVQTYLIGEREKHKESEEYKRAAEEEWASRQEQLRIQGEEAQKLRRRKRAETMRLLDMERRQKQRLEEVRESQKKDEETINLKENIRSEVRKELDKLEMVYQDMASLLRGLGIHLGGGPFPSSHEVNAAYRKALLKFHPDRASRTDLRQQVEAEEKFKMISRLKEKLLPVAY